eukprot:TRINITY_DN40650_c0_g1_i1.p2 TRINITY_DN40650_c0_g1~~TRINITY_DN40650_c0_g1_i1.p2  ORF type:complete len:131 (-),score=13.79 TRINITY_DN40650_c0_g1_i1:554-946(-)
MDDKTTVFSRQYRPTRCYLRVSLVFEAASAPSVVEAAFTSAIAESLQSCFGALGAGQCPWSTVSYDAQTACGILKVTPAGLEKLRFAITLLSRCSGLRCRADIISVAPSLASLACRRAVGIGAEAPCPGS